MFLFKNKKRKYLRVKPEKDYPIRVEVNGENFLEILFANDISEKGMGATVSHEFKGCHIDMPVSLVVSLPFPIRKNILLKGKIKHIADSRFGINFFTPDKKDYKKIKNYVKYRIKQESWFKRIKNKLMIRK